jgi:hypothetical protein
MILLFTISLVGDKWFASFNHTKSIVCALPKAQKKGLE